MHTIIQDFAQRINLRLSTDWMLTIIMPLLIILAYFLGRHDTIINKDKLESSFTINPSPKDMDTTQITSSEVINKVISVGKIYASNKGKKYYIEGLCDSKISIKNKVYYKDESAAIENGKQKAAGCK